MFVLGVIVLGWVSLRELPLEFLPSFSSSNISVRVPYPSASPSEVERDVVLPLEQSLATINGIDALSSSSYADRGNINVTFVDGTDMDWATVEVRDRVERVRHLLPDGVENIRIRRFQSTDIPVMRFHLSSDWESDRMFAFAEEVVQRRLERLDGVAEVDIGGLQTPTIQVLLDPDRLAAHGLDARDLNQAIRGNHINASLGELDERGMRWSIRAVGEFDSVQALRRLPLAGGVRLSDVAEVRYDFPEQWDYNFLNGSEALTFRINKDSTANLIDVVDAVRAELEAIQALPTAEGLRLRIYSDTSEDVRQGLGQLRNTGLLGGLLALAAVFVFLRRYRTTMLIGIAMPLSVVATFVLLFAMRKAGWTDITINVVSLAGLMLALGMLVDNSIVVIESIYSKRNEQGLESTQAAIEGASDVALPIVASTITTMCVFLPLIFLGGEGRFSLYLTNIGLTVCIVIVSSLIIALTVVPLFASRLLRNQAPRPRLRLGWWQRTYDWMLRRTLRHRFAFTVAIVLLLWGSWHLLSTIERSFASRTLDREVVLNIDTPRQYSFEQTRELYEEVYALIDAKRDELDIKDVTYSYDRGTGRSRGGWSRGRQMNIYLADESESTLSTIEIREAVRAMMPTRAGVNIRVANSRSRGGSSGIEVELKGNDPSVLELLSSTIVESLQQIPDIRDVDTSLESGNDEIRVEVSKAQALQVGLSSQAVAQTISSVLSDRAVSRFKAEDREIDIVMQYPEEERETLTQLQNVPVFATEAQLPLGAVAAFRTVSGPRSIERVDGQSKLTISANTTDPRANFAAMGAVQQVLGGLSLPPGYSWSFGRWNRYQQRDSQSGLFAIWFALPLVYMVLASLFESFSQPLTILFSVPFALLGVGVAMKLTEQPWDNMTMIGLIVLIGVVVNNAIVLLDHINRLRRGGLDRTAAILQGCQDRLRPILITAVTTILGMLPMVAPLIFPQWFGPLEGRASTWAPIGLVIVGGLTTSTFLTLLIIPTIYSLIDDAQRFFARVVRSA